MESCPDITVSEEIKTIEDGKDLMNLAKELSHKDTMTKETIVDDQEILNTDAVLTSSH